MPKKKLRDCTYGEVRRFCKKQEHCGDCPLLKCFQVEDWDFDSCMVEYRPQDLPDETLDLEIDLPEEEGAKNIQDKICEYNRLCSKIQTQHVFRGAKGSSHIKERDYTHYCFAYDPDDNAIVVYCTGRFDRLCIDDYGLFWAFTKEELQ